LDRTITDIKLKISKEKTDLDDIENQMNVLKAKYDLKRLEIHQLSNKLEDKSKIVNEARRAYTKVYLND
jgi:hypothetical protein